MTRKSQSLDFCVLFCHTILGTLPGMATLQQKIQCEKDAREMLRENDLPDPDRIEYGHTCIRLFWKESKTVLVVDIDEPPEGFDASVKGLHRPGRRCNDAIDSCRRLEEVGLEVAEVR